MPVVAIKRCAVGISITSTSPVARCTGPEVEVDPLVEGDGVSVAAGLPVAGQAGLDQQALALVVVVGRHLGGQRRARAHRGHPFCQDEKTRLPAEML